MATTRTTRRKKSDETHAQKIMESVKGLKPDDVVNEIGNLQVSLQGTLAGISAAISSKIEKMQQIDEAIDLKGDHLSELCEVEKEALALEDIKVRRQEEREQWDKDRAARNSQWVAEVDEFKNKRERSEEEYAWETQMRHKRIEDDFRARCSADKRAETVRQEELQREWDRREAELAQKENEFTELKEQVAKFDDRLKSEVAKAEAIATNSVKRQYEHQIALLKKDMNAEINLHDEKLVSMNETIANLRTQIVDLSKDLDEARADAREVTSQALQSASGRQVAQALQRVVDTQGQSTKSK